MAKLAFMIGRSLGIGYGIAKVFDKAKCDIVILVGRLDIPKYLSCSVVFPASSA